MGSSGVGETLVDRDTLFAGDSETARLGRAMDWSATPLGPVEEWAPALRTAVQMMLESPFPINLWCGPDLNLIYNDAYRAVLGSKHPRAFGRSGKEVWSEIWSVIGSWFDHIRAGGPSVYAEDAKFVMERVGDAPANAWFTFSLSPVRDDARGVVAFLNIASETTARIDAEREAQHARAAAEQAEHQLREVFAQAPAFLAVLRGPKHVFDFVNDAYVRLIGGRDVIGKPVAEALPEVADQGFVALLDRVLETKQPVVGRETPVMLAATGDTPAKQVYVDFVYQPLTSADGKAIGIVAQGSDVTEAVLARREMELLWHESEQARSDAEASEARYRFLANAIPVQVWTATPDGLLEYVSDRTATYFGRQPGQLLGRQWLSSLHPDDRGRAIERWSKSLESGEPYEMEFRLWSAAHKDYRWHLARGMPQRDESGRIIRWFGTNTDIEDRKRGEAELKRLTAEATNANRAKSDFLAAMSHELRTPLNAIGGYAQLIEMGVRGPVTEQQRVDLVKIQRSKDHLDSLVGDVLNFAKLGAGRVEFHIEEVDVREILDAVLDMVAPQIAQKELHLAPLTAPAGLTMVADADKARQIVINLIANALKFTPAGGTVGLEVKQAGDMVAISVSDTGVGIPADHLDRIFEPFVQAKPALRSGDAGVGLGLAISRQLARGMHGDLSVVSTPGVGSTFTLTLPRRASQPDA